MLKSFTDSLSESINKRTSLKINKDTSENNLSTIFFENSKNYFRKSGIFFVIILIISIIIYYASQSTIVLTKDTFYYSVIIIIPLFIGIFLSTNIASESNLYKVLILIAIVFFISLIGFYYSNISSSTMKTVNYIFIFIIFLIIIVGLALFYFVFSNQLQNQTGGLGIIINFIFYIPCLFSEFILYIKNQIGITPNIVYILFVIEILLILLLIYIPKLLYYYSIKNATVLQYDPVYLDIELPLVKDKKIFLLKDKEKVKTNTSEERTIYRNSNYSFSFWIFINPGSKSKIEYMKETNIFNYANGKPKITCVNDNVDPFKNKCIVYFSNNPLNSELNPDIKNSFEFYLPIQKWNNIVFNYFENSSDLFINGLLEKSFYFDNNNIPLDGNDTDDVVIGSNNGLNGAICNVKYYTFTQTTSQIAYEYNSLIFSNPPIFTS